MGKVESLEQAAELRESIGRIMHESWSVTKRAQGFHGPNEKCVSSRVINGIPTSWSGCVKDTKYVYGEWYRCIYFHPDLIPWEELPEAQKDINRHAFDTVLEKYDLIPKGTLAERERQVWAEAAKQLGEAETALQLFLDACANPKSDGAAEKKAILYAYETGRAYAEKYHPSARGEQVK